MLNPIPTDWDGLIPVPDSISNFKVCTDVSVRELIYLHDNQVLLQELVKFFMGEKHLKSLPIRSLITEKDDYLNIEDKGEE